MERNLDVVSLVGDMDGGVTMNVKKKVNERGRDLSKDQR